MSQLKGCDTPSFPDFLEAVAPTCKADPLSPQGRKFYDDYLRSETWFRIRNRKIANSGGRCERCGAECTTLDVHHLTYKRFGGQELDNDLEALCRKRCHPIADAERKAEMARVIQKLVKERALERKFSRWMEARHGHEWENIDQQTITEERAEFLEHLRGE